MCLRVMVWDGGGYECELFLGFLFEAIFSLEYTSHFGLTAARVRCRGPFPFGGESRKTIKFQRWRTR